jgi:hypothetical protein
MEDWRCCVQRHIQEVPFTIGRCGMTSWANTILPSTSTSHRLKKESCGLDLQFMNDELGHLSTRLRAYARLTSATTST